MPSDWNAAIEGKMRELLEDAGPLQPLVDYLASTRGKRLRPHLVMWTSLACSRASGSEPQDDDVLNVAAAFELVHMASLVHDDIIDGATERRALPTVHLIWGIHSAVLAGDYLFTRANKIALKYSGLGIASLVNQAIELTCEGEVAQDSRLFDCTVSEREYLSHICRKTAALIGAACQAGAILGGATREVEEAMLRFGIELGCAFQIVDDVIDLTSDSATSGKPSCNDIRRGILTLPLIMAMAGPAGGMLERAFGQRSVEGDTVTEIRALCEQSDCIDRARENARVLALSAESRLNALLPSLAKSALAAIARGVVDRRS